jgi:hypothetical protein
MNLRFTLPLLGLLSGSCGGSTGDNLVTFTAAAAGPADPPASGHFGDFDNDRGWHIALTHAVVHIGAVYLNQSVPVSGAQNTDCFLPGTYVAEVTTGQDVDVLSPEPQPFPKLGTGVTIPALTGQVWLTGGNINTVADTTPILSVSGTADRGGVVLPFTGTITIGSSRASTTSSTTLAGANPICKQRIVSPIPTSVEPQTTGSLLLRIDPRRVFANIEFATLPAPLPDTYTFPDDSSDQPSANLYQNLHSSAPYTFQWVP